MALTPPEIRPLEAADWPQVHDVVVEVARGGETYAMAVPASLEETQARWTGERVVVAVDGDKVLGTATMGPNRDAQGGHVATASFMVPAAAQGHGVGRALAEDAVEWLRGQGYRAIQFNAVVSTNVPAVRLWGSLGFRTVGAVPGAFRLPRGELADLLVMHLDLSEDPVPTPTSVLTRLEGAADRAVVLGAAVRHFVERGWELTEPASVAAEAGVTHAALRRVYPTKADLMMAAFRFHTFGGDLGLAETFPADELASHPDVDERLRAYARWATPVVRRMTPFLGVLASAQAGDRTAFAILQGAHMRRLAMTRRLVEAITRGEQSLPDAVEVVQMLVTAETYRNLLYFGWDDDRYAEWLCTALDAAVNGSAATLPSPGRPASA